jgi:diguanylate cyclase (GGDEF)-like protein
MLRRVDGARRWCVLGISAMVSEGKRLLGHVVTVTDVTARKQLEEELRALSSVDELTGLSNRRGFTTLAAQQLKLARRSSEQMLAIFVDLDGMKEINDGLGHQAGDLALKDAAEVLRRCFRDSDILGRIGGDEFAVLAVGAADASAEGITRRLERELRDLHARTRRPYQLSMSMGILPLDPDDPLSLDDLLARADAAMYQQKRLRRSRGGTPPPIPGEAPDGRTGTTA